MRPYLTIPVVNGGAQLPLLPRQERGDDVSGADHEAVESAAALEQQTAHQGAAGVAALPPVDPATVKGLGMGLPVPRPVMAMWPQVDPDGHLLEM
eukprot:Skav204697  [mRNA]  locus=scaffold8204:24039:25866:- [translate_table: standard]